MFLKSSLSKMHWVPTLWRTLGMMDLDSIKPQSSNRAHHLDKDGGSQGRWMLHIARAKLQMSDTTKFFWGPQELHQGRREFLEHALKWTLFHSTKQVI